MPHLNLDEVAWGWAKEAFKGVGLKALRKKAGWDNATLSFILKQGLT